MNLNLLAKEICKREGKKQELSIAQVKEVLRVLMDIFAEEYMRTECGGGIWRETKSFGNNFELAVEDKAWVKTAKKKTPKKKGAKKK